MLKKRLLVVDDSEPVRKATRFAFERDFEVIEAADEFEALNLFESRQPHIVFLDIDFGGLPRGWGILKQIREKGTPAVVLIISGSSSAGKNPAVKDADGFLAKPVELSQLRKFLTRKGML